MNLLQITSKFMLIISIRPRGRDHLWPYRPWTTGIAPLDCNGGRYRLIWVLPHWKGHKSGDEQKLLPDHIESFHETIGQWRIQRVTQQSTAALSPRIISWGNRSMEDLKIDITINWQRTWQTPTYLESWKVLQSVLCFTKRVDSTDIQFWVCGGQKGVSLIQSCSINLNRMKKLKFTDI
jgi:hypothetical protein